MASSSSTCSATHHDKFDVFLNFRGEDTRNGFTSHLHAALCRKSINAFIDDDLRRGDVIGPTLLKIIEESTIAVVIFSKNYASSPWCLDELVKIIECYESRGKLVIPVFYHVNPTDVSEQTGTFAEAFVKYEESKKVQMWRAALTKAANLAGWDSHIIRIESDLVDQISKDIFKKLNQILSHGLERLVGMKSRIKWMIDLLSIGSPDVRKVGIWGIGGVGKTTLAEATFEQIAHQFEVCCFLERVREKSERCDGLISLTKELLFNTIGERDLKICTPNNGSYFIKKMLRGKRALIILDDVNEAKQLEVLLAGDPCWFSPGSRIIITSRDRHVLEKWVDNIYEVKKLMHKEALQLFSQNAFKRNHPPEDLMVESELILKYADGIPLALKVLGNSLFERSKEVWKSALKKLKKAPPADIHDVLKISYRQLDPDDQQIFLHIACFFKGEYKETVIRILDGCGFPSEIGLSNLIDKSLVTLTQGLQLEMHDLLQEMGRAIVHKESTDPGNRSRLWDHEEICQIFMRDTGFEKIEGIFLDISKLRTDLHLKQDAFVKLPNLKLLKFYVSHDDDSFGGYYKVHLFEGLEFLPNDLRYLYWHGYPLNSFPANFQSKHLIELHLPSSKFKWDSNGNQYFGKLKSLDLSNSRCLIKAPARTQAQNPVSMIFGALSKFIMSIGSFRTVTSMTMENCKTIETFPTNFILPSLEILNLRRCLSLKSFPFISKNIKQLILDETSITEVPSSIQSLNKLSTLSLKSCLELEIIPNNIYKLKSLLSIQLSHCSNIKKLPEIMETQRYASDVDLDRTIVEELQPTVERQTRLSLSLLNKCDDNVNLPKSKLENPHELGLSAYSELEIVPEEVQDSQILKKDTTEDGCNLSKSPINLNWACIITSLYLSGLYFETLPEGLNQLSRLHSLDVNSCKRLRLLPELPLSLQRIAASDCTSLEGVTALERIFESDQNGYFEFINCLSLDQNALTILVARARLKMQHLGRMFCRTAKFQFCYPGSEIPDWFPNKTKESSISIQAQPNWCSHKFLGFAFCFVGEFQKYQGGLIFECERQFDDIDGYNNDEDRVLESFFSYNDSRIQSDHVLLYYVGGSCDWLKGWPCNQESLKISAECITDECFKVKEIGVLPLFAQNEEFSGSGNFEEVEEEGGNKRKRCQDEDGSGKEKEKFKQIKGMPAESSSYIMEERCSEYVSTENG